MKTKDDTQLGKRVYNSILEQIGAGFYPAGGMLPSTRTLATEWGISRATVVAAYDQLIAEGYVETRPGARARVLPGVAGAIASSVKPSLPASAPTLSAFGERVALLTYQLPAEPSRLVAEFRYGDVASADFPALAWKQAISKATLQKNVRLRYGDPCGVPELRNALQSYLWRARGLRCETEQIVVMSGSQQGLDLCARLLLDPGDRVLIESPCYNLAWHVFAAAGARPVSIPVDEDGIQTDRLPPARLAYVTPSHQFPLGGVLSAARRMELLAWARANGSYVIEDDYDGEYRYDIRPVPPLYAMDGGESTIYIGTVSKTLSPTLRLGYLVVPKALCSVMTGLKRLSDRHAPALEQQALAALIVGGVYERHVRRMRRKNAERRAALLAALNRHLPGKVTPVGTDAGLHIVAWLDTIPRAREASFVATALNAGLGIYPIGPLYEPAMESARPACAGLVIGYSALTVEEIERGVALLARLIEANRD